MYTSLFYFGSWKVNLKYSTEYMQRIHRVERSINVLIWVLCAEKQWNFSSGWAVFGPAVCMYLPRNPTGATSQ